MKSAIDINMLIVSRKQTNSLNQLNSGITNVSYNGLTIFQRNINFTILKICHLKSLNSLY